MKCSLHSEALVEYRQGALFYADRARGLGEAFVSEVEKALDTIRASPRSRSANQRGVRRHALRRFPYLLHYVIEHEETVHKEEFILIYAIRHTRQDNDWLKRISEAPPNTSG